MKAFNNKILCYQLLLINLAINSVTWINWKFTGIENINWLILLNAQTLGGGLLLWFLVWMSFPKEKAFALFLVIRVMDIFGNFAICGFPTKYNTIIAGIKLGLNAIVLWYVLDELFYIKSKLRFFFNPIIILLGDIIFPILKLVVLIKNIIIRLCKDIKDRF